MSPTSCVGTLVADATRIQSEYSSAAQGAKVLRVIFQLATPLTESEPSREFLQIINGEIRDDDSNVDIGRIVSSLVQVGRVADLGESLFDVVDGQSSEMAEYHAAFFKPNDWDYKEGIRRQFPDILSAINRPKPVDPA
jgi:hypothetical protein